MKKKKFFLLSVVSVLAFSQSWKVYAQDETLDPDPGASKQARTTTIQAKVSVQASWKKRVEYGWEVKKTVAQPHYRITPGEPAQVDFDIEVMRKVSASHEYFMVGGEVCVTNRGSSQTKKLEFRHQIHQRIQGKAGDRYVELPDYRQTIEASQELKPRETRCFPYRIYSVLRPGIDYRNFSEACILNSRGRAGKETCVRVSAPFKLPEAPALTEIDQTAQLVGQSVCPQGYICQLPPLEQVLKEDYQRVFWRASLQSATSDCIPSKFIGKSALTRSDSGIVQPASAETELQCEPGSEPSPNPSPTPPPAPVGCTRSVEFWKGHAGVDGAPDLVSSLLPLRLGACGGSTLEVKTAAEAFKFLSEKACADSPGNPVGKLYSELLGALLNGQTGATSTAVHQALSDAGTFLVRHDCLDGTDLLETEKSAVLDWISRFEHFNQGLIGPGACIASLSRGR